VSVEDAPEQTGPPGRIAVRNPLEAFLWIFITRLIALVTATRAAGAPAASDDDRNPTDATADPDPDRARRVAGSRPPTDPLDAAPAARGAARTATSEDRARAVAVTAAASVVAGAAAFAAGRRRGRG
jgi:hypothetical protein